MMLFLQQSPTATHRRVPIHLVDASDGITPLTGLTGTPERSANGSAFAAVTNAMVEIGNGAYYVELTQAELNIVGFQIIRVQVGASAEYQISTQVVAVDPYAAKWGLYDFDPSAEGVTIDGTLNRLDDLNNFDPTSEAVDVATIKATDAAPLESNMKAGVDLTVSAATDGRTFTITPSTGNWSGRAIVFHETNAANANRGEARVILSHVVGTGVIEVGEAGQDPAAGTPFTNTPNVNDTATLA